MDATGILGLVMGAGFGLMLALAGNAALTKVEESAVVGLDRDKAEAKRSMYATIKRVVLVVDVVIFAGVGWFVASHVI